MPYLHINESSRRPQFVSEDEVEDNWRNVFGSVNPLIEKIEAREKEETQQESRSIMVCNQCGCEFDYKSGMTAFCPECKTGLLEFKVAIASC